MAASLVDQTVLQNAAAQGITESGTSGSGSQDKAGLASLASTRANSPESSITSDDADGCGVSSLKKLPSSSSTSLEQLGTLGERRGIRAAILKDLGVEIKSKDKTCPAPTTVAGTPHAPPCTPASPPIHLTSTLPPQSGSATPVAKDASQRSVALAAFGDASKRCPLTTDASQRSPMVPPSPMGDASQRSPLFSPGLMNAARAGDASQRTPTHALTPQSKSGLVLGSVPPNRLGVYDTSGMTPVSSSSWGAAAAAVEATRSAAVGPTLEAQNFGPPQALDSQLAQASTSVGNLESAQQVQVPYAQDPLHFWLSAIPDSCTLSAHELAARLRAAQPETYDD